MAQSYNITTNSASTTQVRFLAPKDYDSTDIYMVNGGLRQLKQVDGNPIVHGWVTGAPLVFNLGEDGISMYMDINDVGVSKSVTVSSLEVGSILKLKKSDGSEVEYLIVHQGLPDATLYDTSCDGTWVLRKDILEKRAWDSTNNDYGNSDIHAYLNTTFVNTFDAKTKNAIKQVKIPYQKGTGFDGSVASGANGLSCNIFLLSGYEVGWTTSDDSRFPIDGVKLSYFDSGTDSTANNKRIANYNGSQASWWLRSPSIGYSNYVWHIFAGGIDSFANYKTTYGIRPAMVLDSNSLCSKNDDGSYTLVGGGLDNCELQQISYQIPVTIPYRGSWSIGANGNLVVVDSNEVGHSYRFFNGNIQSYDESYNFGASQVGAHPLSYALPLTDTRMVSVYTGYPGGYPVNSFVDGVSAGTNYLRTEFLSDFFLIDKSITKASKSYNIGGEHINGELLLQEYDAINNTVGDSYNYLEYTFSRDAKFNILKENETDDNLYVYMAITSGGLSSDSVGIYRQKVTDMTVGEVCYNFDTVYGGQKYQLLSFDGKVYFVGINNTTYTLDIYDAVNKTKVGSFDTLDSNWMILKTSYCVPYIYVYDNNTTLRVYNLDGEKLLEFDTTYESYGSSVDSDSVATMSNKVVSMISLDNGNYLYVSNSITHFSTL